MVWIALRMLTGNLGKYLGIVLGISFASLLISQQASIFCGLMSLTASQVRDIRGAQIWVMDPNVRFVDDIKLLRDSALLRVRGVPGVAWAEAELTRLKAGSWQRDIDITMATLPQMQAQLEAVDTDLERLRVKAP